MRTIAALETSNSKKIRNGLSTSEKVSLCQEGAVFYTKSCWHVGCGSIWVARVNVHWCKAKAAIFCVERLLFVGFWEQTLWRTNLTFFVLKSAGFRHKCSVLNWKTTEICFWIYTKCTGLFPIWHKMFLDLQKMSGIVSDLTQNVFGFTQNVRYCFWFDTKCFWIYRKCPGLFLTWHKMFLDLHKMFGIVSDLTQNVFGFTQNFRDFFSDLTQTVLGFAQNFRDCFWLDTRCLWIYTKCASLFLIRRKRIGLSAELRKNLFSWSHYKNCCWLCTKTSCFWVDTKCFVGLRMIGFSLARHVSWSCTEFSDLHSFWFEATKNVLTIFNSWANDDKPGFTWFGFLACFFWCIFQIWGK